MCHNFCGLVRSNDSQASSGRCQAHLIDCPLLLIIAIAGCFALYRFENIGGPLGRRSLRSEGVGQFRGSYFRNEIFKLRAGPPIANQA